jgi:rsbT co-antagonist protein RsbR
MVDARARRPARLSGESTAGLLRELVAHLRQNRTQLREEWVRKITAQLLTAMTREEIFAEATSVYDSYVEALETGHGGGAQAYSRNLSERIIPRGVETNEVVGIVPSCATCCALAVCEVPGDVRMLSLVLDAYEPAANRIAITVAVGFVQQRSGSSASSRKRFGAVHSRVCRSASACSSCPSSD